MGKISQLCFVFFSDSIKMRLICIKTFGTPIFLPLFWTYFSPFDCLFHQISQDSLRIPRFSARIWEHFRYKNKQPPPPETQKKTDPSRPRMWSKYKKVRRIKSFRSLSWALIVQLKAPARWLWIRWYKRMKFIVPSEIDPIHIYPLNQAFGGKKIGERPWLNFFGWPFHGHSLTSKGPTLATWNCDG